MSYTPAADFSGDDAFTYRVSDALNQSAPATVRITVKPPPPLLCANGPIAGCRQAQSRAGRLILKDKSPDAGDRLVWKWSRGAATSPADFGAPLSTTGYLLCAYDAADNTIARASAPPGGNCGARPCWREKSTKTTYRSSSLAMTLTPGTAGKAKIVLRGRGAHLGLDPLPASQPVTVQLKHSDGVCWEAVYSAPAQRNEAGQFRDKSD